MFRRSLRVLSAHSHGQGQPHPHGHGAAIVFEALSSKTTAVTLNKPQALNALDLHMIQALNTEIRRVEAAAQPPKVLIFEGAGGKAFCAGGDVRRLYDTRDASGKASETQVRFFTEEYDVDHLIATLPSRGIQQVCACVCVCVCVCVRVWMCVCVCV
jgi:enoyl-CoA hydratase/carnithine racemase